MNSAVPDVEGEFVEKMNALTAKDKDQEYSHQEADELVSNALRHLGWHKLAQAYDKGTGAPDKMGYALWWYA